MAVTTTFTANLELTYADYTTRNYKIPLQTEAAPYVVSKIQAFNAAAADSNSSVSKTFLSNGGAQVGSITEATTVYREEEEIYHA